MAIILVGVNPVQVAKRNPRRASISVQMMPTSIQAGNTGKVYGKFGSAPTASDTSGTWDFTLVAGAADGSNVAEGADRANDERELWLVASAAGQYVNVVEKYLPPEAAEEKK